MFSISVSTLIAFCEFHDYTGCVKKILDFSVVLSGTIGSDLGEEISAARNFIFVNLKHLSDDENLVNKAEGLTHTSLSSLYEDEFEHHYTDLEVV